MKPEAVETMIRADWFKDHVATWKVFGSNDGSRIEHLRWAKPGTGIYWIDYYTIPCGKAWELVVTGDVGNATYGWGMPLIVADKTIFDWIAGLNLDYFAGKCGASEVGRQYQTFDGDEAGASFLEAIRQHYENQPEKIDEMIHEAVQEGVECCAGASEWTMWLCSNAPGILGDYWTEYGLTGMAVDSRCRAHLIGVQMAVSQLRGLDKR